MNTIKSEDDMREIKFRAKTKHNQWVIGGYAKRSGKHFIIRDIYEPAIPVISETVGQFTGLKDKNGKEIYEGDVIKWLTKEWVIKVDLTHGIRFLYGKDQITKGVADNCEVIVNIHENPELI